jgi:hypothetical protein
MKSLKQLLSERRPAQAGPNKQTNKHKENDIMIEAMEKYTNGNIKDAKQAMKDEGVKLSELLAFYMANHNVTDEDIVLFVARLQG